VNAPPQGLGILLFRDFTLLFSNSDLDVCCLFHPVNAPPQYEAWVFCFPYTL